MKPRATSRAAADHIAPRAGSLRAKLLLAIVGRGHLGYTDEEAQLRIPMKGSTQRPRRGELEEAGLIEERGTRPVRSGLDATVWVATDEGRRRACFLVPPRQLARSGPPEEA